MIEALLRGGARVNAKNLTDDTPIRIAVRQGEIACAHGWDLSDWVYRLSPSSTVSAQEWRECQPGKGRAPFNRCCFTRWRHRDPTTAYTSLSYDRRFEDAGGPAHVGHRLQHWLPSPSRDLVWYLNCFLPSVRNSLFSGNLECLKFLESHGGDINSLYKDSTTTMTAAEHGECHHIHSADFQSTL